ncbi:unnamed protein product [Schistocephalus solidus]|uniref:Uncharacterized protein n=1 Tax=Schistocephalus solidus TaxID=70667 RepID=A0A183SB37_SCHSO|nr:unnamed protein product [Schistocephalus solidus]
MWWYTDGRLRPRQSPAPSPISDLIDSVLTPGSGGGGEECLVAAAQGYSHFKLIHAQVTVPAPPGVEHTVDLVEIDGRTVVCVICARSCHGARRRVRRSVGQCAHSYIRKLSGSGGGLIVAQRIFLAINHLTRLKLSRCAKIRGLESCQLTG